MINGWKRGLGRLGKRGFARNEFEEEWLGIDPPARRRGTPKTIAGGKNLETIYWDVLKKSMGTAGEGGTSSYELGITS